MSGTGSEPPKDWRPVHELKRTLNENVFYPEHPPRRASLEFEATRKRLIVDMDTPCWICGIRRSTGGKMELHHEVVEWALENAVDPAKLGVEFPDVTDEISLRTFIDSGLNGMVLCDRHHRHIEEGIHSLTYPIWRAQRYVRQGYELTEKDRAKPQ